MKIFSYRLRHLLLFNLLLGGFYASAESKLSEIKEVGITYGKGYPLYVFASPTCPFCRQFHKEVMPELVDNGFEVTYLIIPHDKHKSYKRAAEVYCAKDRKAQLNDYHAALLPTELVEGKPCQAMVDDMINIAYEYKVTSTPTIVFPDESIIKGISSFEVILGKYFVAETSQK